MNAQSTGFKILASVLTYMISLCFTVIGMRAHERPNVCQWEMHRMVLLRRKTTKPFIGLYLLLIVLILNIGLVYMKFIIIILQSHDIPISNPYVLYRCVKMKLHYNS